MEVSSLRHASAAYAQEDSLIPSVDGGVVGLRSPYERYDGENFARTQSGLRLARKVTESAFTTP
jgi:hypothetical protein